MRTEGEPPGPTVNVTELRTCISRMHFPSLCPMVLLRNYCTCVLQNAFPQPLSDGSDLLAFLLHAFSLCSVRNSPAQSPLLVSS